MHETTPESWRRIDELFHAAVETGPAARTALLADVSPIELREEVVRLLSQHDSSGDFLRPPDSDLEDTVAASHVGRWIGGYRIIRLIAAGGMGVVYEAEQERPHRAVALKVLRGGFASPAARRRFQFESELLGRLRHPGIAQIYEAGTHDEGVLSIPYFAMEYIPDAATLIDFANANRLAAPARVKLFAQVCDAVHYGHQQGVIHRDLKPGNILVDAAGAPRIIDFGVGRALIDELPATLLTDAGQLIGTLQYMSPEQIRGDSSEIDTRSDIYSLGVLLFEMLAGRRPREFSELNIAAAVRMIEDTPIPSLGSLDRELCGDLSTIVATALDSDKRMRYQAVSDLAGDLRRYLANEPISARPPGSVYLLRKFAARHRGLVGGVIAAMVCLLAGAGVSTWQALRANAERDRAQLQTRRTERINAFLRNIFAAADPATSTADVSVREALDRAAGTIEREMAGDPQVAADVHKMIGGIYRRIGETLEAERHLRAALAARRQVFGAESLEAADALTELAWSALCNDPNAPHALFAEALEIYRKQLGDEHEKTAIAKSVMASHMNDRSQWSAAEPLLREAIATLKKIGAASTPDAAFAIKHLGVSLQGQGKLSESDANFREAISIHRATLGSDHYETGITLKNYAKFLRQAGRVEEAANVEQEGTRILERRVGEQAD